MSDKFNPRIHIGETHGIYTIIDMLDEKDKYGHWIYKCICNECGFEKFSHYGAISGKYKATKCKHLRANGKYIPYGYIWKSKRLQSIFQGMVRRCYAKDDKSYRWYGGNGIKICEQWLNNPQNFEEWAMLNGYSDNLTIDRIDSNQNYCPENCKWIPIEENTRKAGKVNWITIGKETLTGRQWAKRLHIGVNTINTAIRNYGVNKTKELIVAIIKNPSLINYRKSNQSLFSIYGIQM